MKSHQLPGAQAPVVLAPFMVRKLARQKTSSGWRTLGLASIAFAMLTATATAYMARDSELASSPIQTVYGQAPLLIAKLSTPTTTSPNATASIADKIQAATDILAKDEIAVGQAPNSLMSHESIEGLSLADDTANQTVQNDGSANGSVLKTPDLSSVSKSQSTPAQPTVIAGVGLSTLEATPVRSVPFSTFAPGLEVFQSEQPATKQPKRASSESECRKTLARITRASTVWFPIGSATLTARSETQLKKLSDELRSCRESEVEVGGHTDRLGADGQNFTLSWKRAEAVAARLIEYGIETDRLLVVGFGPRRPLARPGQSPIGDPAALNRRVEILLR